LDVEELGLWLGTWTGPYQGYDAVWLRFYDRDGRPVPTWAKAAEVAEAEAARLRERVAELERQQRPADDAGR
jgi:hypothetical protein